MGPKTPGSPFMAEHDFLLHISFDTGMSLRNTQTIIVATSGHAEIIIAEHMGRHNGGIDYSYTLDSSPWYYIDNRLYCPGCEFAVCPFNVIE